jgi:hypothetical protein
MRWSALQSTIYSTTFVLLTFILLGGFGAFLVIDEATAMKESERVRQYVVQRWMHSYEEDMGSEIVYRPATFNFPRSRGRSGFEFSPDGTCTVIGIGQTESAQKSECRWDLNDAEYVDIIIYLESGETRVLHVKEIEQSKLVVLKK